MLRPFQPYISRTTDHYRLPTLTFNNFNESFHSKQNWRSYQKNKFTSNTEERQRRFENLRDGQSAQQILRYLLYSIYVRHFLLVA
jgi:hypothetical protein